MPKLKLTTSAAIILASAIDYPSPAAADAYVTLIAGGVFASDTETEGVDFEFDTGYEVGAAIGNRFGDSFRLELAGAYQMFDVGEIEGIELDLFELEADVSAIRATLSAYWDFPSISGQSVEIRPYVGAGGGVSILELDSNFGLEDDATRATAHGEAGASIGLGSAFAIVPSYQYQWTDAFGDDLWAHVVRVGLRYGL